MARRFHLSLPLLGLAACLVATVLVRLPYLGSIGPDEGGYAYVAQRWADGATLYRGVWIDRPQGLIAVYRGLLAVGSDARTIRAGAIAAAVLLVVLLAAIARELAGTRAALFAAGLFAVAGVAPHIEGFTLNGELVAAVPAGAAVLTAVRSRGRIGWLVAAGVAGGLALTAKQSAVDGLVVAAFVAVVGGAGRWRRLGAVALGAALPIGVCVAAGLRDGWHTYWTALAGYELRERGAGMGLAARLGHALASAPAGARDLLPLALVAGAGLVAARRRSDLRVSVPLVWTLASAAAVNVGGMYWPHYYVQLLPPLVLGAALAVAALPRPVALAAAAALAAPATLTVATAAAAPDRVADRTVTYARGFDNDARIAAWLRSHSSPRSSVYVVYSRADIYFLADRRAAFPYLWSAPLDGIPHALGRLARVLSGPRRPRYVVEAQRPGEADHGRIAAALRRDYKLVWRSPGWGTDVLAPRASR
jgi:4-amino-4-deoxy-L-arabinose transferase-like glycosyltransferase